jgi:uncharacterized protein with PQ loop repeat
MTRMGFGYFEIIGFIAGGISVSVIIPQLIKVVKNGSNIGVSFGMWFLTTCAYASWTSYALRFNSLSMLVANIIAVTISLILLKTILRQNSKLNILNMFIIFFVPLFFAVTVYYINVLFIAILLVGFDMSRMLQIKKSWLTYRNSLHSDVAISTHLLSMVASSFWMTYSSLTGLWVNVLTTAFIILYGTIIVSLETAAKRRREKAVIKQLD